MTDHTPLTFDQLRAANLARLPAFKNGKGEPAHSEADGSDWCLAQWSNATLGELGEAANLIKKIERGDLSLDAARDDLADELADAVTYLDLQAYRAGIDLGAATARKWNRVSERVGFDLRLPEPGRDPDPTHGVQFAGARPGTIEDRPIEIVASSSGVYVEAAITNERALGVAIELLQLYLRNRELAASR